MTKENLGLLKSTLKLLLTVEAKQIEKKKPQSIFGRQHSGRISSLLKMFVVHKMFILTFPKHFSQEKYSWLCASFYYMTTRENIMEE